MIKNIKLHGFKSFINLDLELGLFNVFIGANGSGKSNLLEAIGVAGASVFGSVEPESLRYRGVRLGNPDSYKERFADASSPSLMFEISSSDRVTYKVAFREPRDKNSWSWSFGFEKIESFYRDGRPRPFLDRNGTDCNLYSRSVSGPQIIKLPEDQSAAKLAMRIQTKSDPRVQRLLDSLERYAIYSPSTQVLRDLAEDVSREPLGLSGSGLARVVRDLINPETESFGPFDLDDIWGLIEWASEMRVIPSSDILVSPTLRTGPDVLTFVDRYINDPKNGLLTAYNASEGALHILFLLALIGHTKAPPLIAIDNFDQSLHPRVACQLTRLICTQLVASRKRQVLVTTHNPLVLDGLDLFDPQIRLFTVDRDARGASQVRRITVTPELKEQADKGLSLSRLWLQGLLGGVPRLS